MIRILLLLGLSTSLSAAQNREPSYTTAGRKVDSAYADYRSELETRIKQVHAACRTYNRVLCKPLTPTPVRPAPKGYQVLPSITVNLPRAEPPKHPRLEKTFYSWPRTLAFIERERAIMDEIHQQLGSLSKLSKPDARVVLKQIVAGALKLRQAHTVIDEHVKYNWFWQSRVDSQQSSFTKAAALLARAEKSPRDVDLARMFDVQKPQYIKRIGSTFSVPVVTDISDPAFIAVFKKAVEEEWRTEHYQVKLDIRTFSPKLPPGFDPSQNLDAHLQLFPSNAAVLTTGALRSFERLGSAIVLGPERLTPRELAHKFGHILGFPDFYLRAATDLGSSGYEIIEAVIETDDLMAEPQRGRVRASHFEQLQVTTETKL